MIPAIPRNNRLSLFTCHIHIYTHILYVFQISINVIRVICHTYRRAVLAMKAIRSFWIFPSQFYPFFHNFFFLFNDFFFFFFHSKNSKNTHAIKIKFITIIELLLNNFTNYSSFTTIFICTKIETKNNI